MARNPLEARPEVKRISDATYEETRQMLPVFLADVIQTTLEFHDEPWKTLSALDLVYALKRQGQQLYGLADDRQQSPVEAPYYDGVSTTLP